MSDAREVVKTGDIVQVRVLEVDLGRGRISLTMKPDASPQTRGGGERPNAFRPAGRSERAQPGRGGRNEPAAQGAMAAAFAKLQKRG